MCTRAASVEEESKWWCAMHVPSTVAKRRQEKSEEWERERQQQRATWEAERQREARRDKLEAAAPKVIAALEELISIASDMSDDEIAKMSPGQVAGEITWRDITKARAALADLKGE